MASSSQKNAQQKSLMSSSDENLMRLTFFVRRTCDQLSRDLMAHVLEKIHSTDWDTFVADPNCKEDYKKILKNRFGDRIPALDECDTTILFDFYKKQAFFYPVGLKRNTEFDSKMDTIKKFRNDSAHFTNLTLTDADYEDKLNGFISIIKDFESNIFVNLDSCLLFIQNNKFKTSANLCQTNPEEMTEFLSTLDERLISIAKGVESLNALVLKIDTMDDRITKNEETLNQLIQGARPVIPMSNLIKVPKLAGRSRDLEEIGDCLSSSQLVLICGPPGMGKTSVALAFAKDQTETSQCRRK